MGGFKNPFVKSLINLNADYSGRFFFNLKRYRASRVFLANLNILNRVRPRALLDFMIHKRQLPYSKVGRFRLLKQAFLLFFGAKLGNSKAFYKRFHSNVLGIHNRREDYIVRAFVCRLDFFLYNLKFFDTITDAKNYINRFGVFINDLLTRDNRRILQQLQIVSFINVHRLFFKARFYYFFSNSLLFSPYYKKLKQFFYSVFYNQHNTFSCSLLNRVEQLRLVGSFGYGQSTVISPNAIFTCNNQLSEHLIAFALGFKRCKWVKRWRGLRVGHPENIERLFSHRLSVSPFMFDSLIFWFVSRVRRFLTREFFYKQKRKIRKKKYSTKLFFSRFRFLRKKRRNVDERARWYSRKLRFVFSKKRLFAQFFFFQEFTRGFLRLLFWRFRKLKLFSMLCRLTGRFSTNFAVARFLTFDEKLLFMSKLRSEILLNFKFFSKTVAQVDLLLPPSTLWSRVSGGSLNYFSSLFFDLRLKNKQKFATNQLTSRIVKRGWGRRLKFCRIFVKNIAKSSLFFKFKREYVQYSPFYYFGSLNYIPWYERRPFSRSKFTRFFRLHPRFASIFFPNFLPRFVEPSFKKFEFLIRPVLLSSFDLRLPFQVKKSTKFNLVSSLV